MPRRKSAARPEMGRSANQANARHELRLITERVMRCGAAARQAGQMSDDELQEFRLALKRGAENKLGVVNTVAAVRRDLEALAARYEERLREAGLPATGAPSEEPTGVRPTPTDVGDDIQASPVIDVEQVGHGDVGPRRPCRGRPRGTGKAQRRRNPAELADAERAEYALRVSLVTAMERGSTAAEALRLAGRADTPANCRWAQRIFERFRNTGRVDDRRRAPGPRGADVMLPGLAAVAEALWLRHRGASGAAILTRIKDMIAELTGQHAAGKDISYHPLGRTLLDGDFELGLPSVATIYRFFASLGADKAKIRELGWAEWVKQNRVITKEQPWAFFANERWEIDHTPLPIAVRYEEDNGMWKEATPHLTAIIDVFSRAILAVILSLRTPDAFTTSIALRMAILPKRHWPSWTPRGLPRVLVMDRGKDFLAADVKETLRLLKVEPEVCAPKSPDEKPHIERFFLTVKQNFLPMQAGFSHGADRGLPWAQSRIMGLLTLPELRVRLERWVAEVYHQTKHEGIGARPVTLWEESVPEVVVPPRDDLDIMLLQSDRRRVRRGFVRLTVHRGEKRLYYCSALLRATDKEVILRYNPDDLVSVMVYDPITRDRIGEAYDIRSKESPYTLEDIREEATEYRKRLAAEVKPLIRRGEDYFGHIAAHDRERRKRSVAAAQETQELRAEVDRRIAVAEAVVAAPGFVGAAAAAQDEEDELERELRRRHLVARAAHTPGPATAAPASLATEGTGGTPPAPRLSRVS